MDEKDAIKLVALEHDVPLEEVRNEMISAIRHAMSNPNFKAIFGDQEPSPEELVAKLNELL